MGTFDDRRIGPLTQGPAAMTARGGPFSGFTAWDEGGLTLVDAVSNRVIPTNLVQTSAAGSDVSFEPTTATVTFTGAASYFVAASVTWSEGGGSNSLGAMRGIGFFYLNGPYFNALVPGLTNTTPANQAGNTFHQCGGGLAFDAGAQVRLYLVQRNDAFLSVNAFDITLTVLKLFAV